jgi:hypothetical protein
MVSRPREQLMPSQERERIAELEQEVDRLMREVDRYRTAAEDALQQLDWCIGYFAGNRKPAIARALNGNQVQIRRQFLRRAAQPVPAMLDQRQ